jgi:ATP/maltotriose-dependent transcriptional regulator MalT
MRIIPRPRLLRLIEQFQQSDHPLIVICAPAGYGKSVLLSQIALQIAETPDPPVLIDNYTPGTPLPTNKRVIIATRTDPDLHGLRITADDLRFTRDEITEFLRLYGMRDDLLDPLEQRTEGWAAGLHLARNIARRDGSVSPLMCSGTHRYVSDYFTSEVFAQQPPHIQHFLVQTSILDELDPDLCGAVTRTAHASALLNRIRRDNLFLSESGTRFHPLFAEYLRARLERPEPLHRLAAVWYVQRGKLVQAVPHLIAAQQHESVMRIITQVAFDPASGIDDHTLRDWLGALPDLSPELRLMYAGLLLRVGNVGSAAEHLRHVQTEYGDVQSTVAGALAHLGGDVRASAEHFRHALDTSPNPALRHAVELNIADARRTLGELPFARFGYADIVVRQHGDPHKRAVIALCQRGFLHLAQEQIRQAASMFNEALGIAPNDPLVHIGLAHTHLEQHQLALAERHAAHDPVLSREALAAVYHASGHIDQALQQLAGIEFSDPAFSRYEAQIAMQKAMLYLRKGARSHGRCAADSMPTIRRICPT